MKRGLITKSTGKFYEMVDTESGDKLTGIIRGKFKLDGLPLTNPLSVGDYVGFEMEEELAVVKTIEDRENYVLRQSPRHKHQVHILASNIDQAVLIVTIKEPRLKQGFIDRFLLMTEPYNIPVIIVFNKSDLFGPGEQRLFTFLEEIYNSIGFTVLKASALTGESLDVLSEIVGAKVTLFAGQSGVGKSSIINHILPDLDLKTQDLSSYTGKGMHTTTFAEMFDLPGGGKIIDTPGIKALAFNHLEVMDVAHNFREFFEASKDCKFADCTHRDEPKCAVKEAIQNDVISELRYANYLKILDEIENQNYWERIKDY